MFTAQQILDLAIAGKSAAEIAELASMAEAASPVAEPVAPSPRAGKATPDWIVQRAINSEARKALAADLRGKGLDPSDSKVWKKAKKAAGIA